MQHIFEIWDTFDFKIRDYLRLLLNSSRFQLEIIKINAKFK
jgi:hypothetical protein